ADLSTLPDSRELASFAGEVEAVAMIHNAAVIGPFDAIGALPAGEIDAAVTVNLVAPMVLTNALLAGGLRGDRGGEPGGEGSRRVSVLFISSSAAHRVSGGRSVYSATKRGGEAFFEALAAQYAGDDRVYVAVVDPGIMDTPMQATIRRVARGAAAARRGGPPHHPYPPGPLETGRRLATCVRPRIPRCARKWNKNGITLRTCPSLRSACRSSTGSRTWRRPWPASAARPFRTSGW